MFRPSELAFFAAGIAIFASHFTFATRYQALITPATLPPFLTSSVVSRFPARVIVSSDTDPSIHRHPILSM